MSAWILVPSLVGLRNEFNKLAPARDKGADGSIGDTNHTSSSDHTPDEDSDVLRNKDADSENEVHALDIDSTGPWPNGTTFKTHFLKVIAGEKKKWLDPDDVCRLEYGIYDRKIYSRSRDFEPVDYTGTDPHTNHGHFSGRYLTKSEKDTRPWGVYEEDESMSAADVASLKTYIADVKADLAERIDRVSEDVHGRAIGNKAYTTRNEDHVLNDLAAFLDDMVGDAKGAATRPAKPGSFGALLKELAVAQVPSRLGTLESNLSELAGRVDVVNQKLDLISQILDRLVPATPPTGS